MSDIAPIGRPNPAAFTRNNRVNNVDGQSTGTTRGSDSVELSSAARFLGKLKELPDIRQDLVDRVRSEIEQGNYDTEEKVDAILDDVSQDLT